MTSLIRSMDDMDTIINKGNIHIVLAYTGDHSKKTVNSTLIENYHLGLIPIIGDNHPSKKKNEITGHTISLDMTGHTIDDFMTKPEDLQTVPSLTLESLPMKMAEREVQNEEKEDDRGYPAAAAPSAAINEDDVVKVSFFSTYGDDGSTYGDNVNVSFSSSYTQEDDMISTTSEDIEAIQQNLHPIFKFVNKRLDYRREISDGSIVFCQGSAPLKAAVGASCQEKKNVRLYVDQ